MRDSKLHIDGTDFDKLIDMHNAEYVEEVQEIDEVREHYPKPRSKKRVDTSSPSTRPRKATVRPLRRVPKRLLSRLASPSPTRTMATPSRPCCAPTPSTRNSSVTGPRPPIGQQAPARASDVCGHGVLLRAPPHTGRSRTGIPTADDLRPTPPIRCWSSATTGTQRPTMTAPFAPPRCCPTLGSCPVTTSATPPTERRTV